jgi:hypothetical protein
MSAHAEPHYLSLADPFDRPERRLCLLARGRLVRTGRSYRAGQAGTNRRAACTSRDQQQRLSCRDGCRQLGGDEVVTALVARSLSHTVDLFVACLSGPDHEQAEREIGVLLQSTRFPRRQTSSTAPPVARIGGSASASSVAYGTFMVRGTVKDAGKFTKTPRPEPGFARR